MAVLLFFTPKQGNTHHHFLVTIAISFIIIIRFRDCQIINCDSNIAVYCSLKEKDEHGRDNYEFVNNTIECIESDVCRCGIFELKEAEGQLSDSFYETIQSSNRIKVNGIETSQFFQESFDY